ncbi:TPR domain protein [Aspergillus sclerotiicarbonarius CBS 121057]|uniref:TPR domain protein n=1 Tax=Aspergillus sclerotiicarbonarius (strain CBS 121057 / IBT 28362) TaxID=1448318 RepID=A0A319EDS6_ASPSB|nr:TPR domain protein [Aspergillus sclerotiicarbonarius CBS 121057]
MSLVPDSVLPIPPTDDYYNLGTYTRDISSTNDAAKVWFNRGLIWSYAFNHTEAYRCFEQAIIHDRTCAIAYWGLAYAIGPNYNKAWRLFDPVDLEHTMKLGYEAIKHAHTLLQTTSTTLIEQALIEAMQTRFPTPHPSPDYTPINDAYCHAMQDVHARFPQDIDAITLYIDAQMHTAQRKMFDINSGLPIASSPVHTLQNLFTTTLNHHPQAPSHPGLLHFHIHFSEMSSTPSTALRAADYLRNLVPDAGHLHHMPTHLDILIGDYRRAIASNTAAIHADEKYLALNGPKNMYSFYRLHDYHSLIYAAMLSGQRQIALQVLDPMESTLTEDVLRTESPPLADWLEFFKSVRVHVYIRFGMWDEIIALSLPPAEKRDLYCVTTAMTHYGKGIAYAATGNLPDADAQRELYLTAAGRVPDSRRDYPNRIMDVLKVATAMLNGEIEYRRGRYEVAFEHLREAVRYDDALLYTEPWGWMVPTRHAYGALLLEQGYVEEAARAYAEDLGIEDRLTRAHQHPGTVWALHGYYECLGRLGRHAEARIIKQQLDVAVGVADVDVSSSCFCRLGVEEGCCR